MYILEGTTNGEKFSEFVQKCLLPCLNPFNGINSWSVVVMDNASIHHMDEVEDLIENQANARLYFLPPYSPDLMPAEDVFSKVKTLLKDNSHTYQALPRLLIATAFGMITKEDCQSFISH